MKTISINDLRTYEEYAEQNTSDEQPLSRQRIRQLVNDGRLKIIILSGRKFIHKNAKIKPSKKKIGRPSLKKKK